MVEDFLNGFLSLVQGRGEHWGFEERRSLIRLRCSYKCLYEPDQQRLPGRITDLGEGGLAVTSAQALQVGQRVKVFCPFIDLEGPNGAIEGVVCWTRSLAGLHNAGLSYTVTPDSWVASILNLLGFPSQSARSKRRWVRADCALPASIGEHTVQVHNLGVGGALIESAQPLPEASSEVLIGPYLKLAVMQLNGTMGERRSDGLYVFQFQELSGPQLKLLGLYLKALLRRSFSPTP